MLLFSVLIIMLLSLPTMLILHLSFVMLGQGLCKPHFHFATWVSFLLSVVWRLEDRRVRKGLAASCLRVSPLSVALAALSSLFNSFISRPALTPSLVTTSTPGTHSHCQFSAVHFCP